jgi:hypothetical protein
VQKNQQMQQQLRAPLFEDKVVDHIFAAAKVTEKTVTKDKLDRALHLRLPASACGLYRQCRALLSYPQ